MRNTLAILAILFLAACESTPVKPMQGLEDTKSLSPEEYRLWHSARELDEKLENADYLYEDKELQVYLETVMQRLYPEYADSISVRIIDSPSLNAFALPNGSIYINTGMLSRLDNEAQVATVLAHEGVHFTHKHSLQQRRTQKSSTAFSVGFGMVVGIPALGDLIALSSIYGFSKELEREADAGGFQRLQAAGYDVSQAPVTFEFLLAEVEALEIDEPYFFSSHPGLKERIQSFRELVDQHDTSNGFLGAEPYRAHVDKLQLELLADYLELGQYQSVLLILERPDAFYRYPPSAWYHLGEAYRLRGEEGDVEHALTAYRTAEQQAPGFAPTYRALGLYYMKNGEPAEASNYFSYYLELQPDAADRGYVEHYQKKLRAGD
ncbi:MAG: M48 family metalloprotease [Gammaproteobacteria bacterium]